MYTEMIGKLGKLVDSVDYQGLKELAWQELKRDSVLTGEKTDIELMMKEMRDIMRIRVDELVAKEAGQIVLRQIRKNLATNILNWIMAKHVAEHVAAKEGVYDDDWYELGVAG